MEWKAQFQTVQNAKTRKEKSEHRKMEEDLLKLVHQDGKSHREFSFWEKMGFDNKKKVSKTFEEVKSSLDFMYYNIKEVVEKSQSLKGQIEDEESEISRLMAI
jgi:hypothetical protein